MRKLTFVVIFLSFILLFSVFCFGQARGGGRSFSSGGRSFSGGGRSFSGGRPGGISGRAGGWGGGAFRGGYGGGFRGGSGFRGGYGFRGGLRLPGQVRLWGGDWFRLRGLGVWISVLGRLLALVRLRRSLLLPSLLLPLRRWLRVGPGSCLWAPRRGDSAVPE
jgi:hypothetical protein